MQEQENARHRNANDIDQACWNRPIERIGRVRAGTFAAKLETELKSLSRLHRQMYWVYGGYVVLAIVAFGLISLFHAHELAIGGGLARAVCGYIAVFRGARLVLQAVFDVKEHLTAWWLKAGYHVLTCLFTGFTLLYGYAALRPWT